MLLYRHTEEYDFNNPLMFAKKYFRKIIVDAEGADYKWIRGSMKGNLEGKW